MIITVASQKGGVGKSTLARALTLAYHNAKWDTVLADMDNVQNTSSNWNIDRTEMNSDKCLKVISCSSKEEVESISNIHDLIVVDGSPFASDITLEIAKISDLIIFPTKICNDDLRPQLKLAHELVSRGVPRNHILFTICMVPENGAKDVMEVKRVIKDWEFEVCQAWIDYKYSYMTAQNRGLAITELSHKGPREKAIKQVNQVMSFAENLTAIEA